MASEEIQREVKLLEQAIRNAIEFSDDVQEAVERIRESGFPIALHLMCLFGSPEELEGEFPVEIGEFEEMSGMGSIMAHFEMGQSVPEFEVTDDDHKFLDDLGICW